MDDRPEVEEAGEYRVGEPEGHQVDVVFTPRELDMIAEAENSLARGLYVDGEEMHAWLASVGTAGALPVPPVRQRG